MAKSGAGLQTSPQCFSHQMKQDQAPQETLRHNSRHDDIFFFGGTYVQTTCLEMRRECYSQYYIGQNGVSRAGDAQLKPHTPLIRITQCLSRRGYSRTGLLAERAL